MLLIETAKTHLISGLRYLHHPTGKSIQIYYVTRERMIQYHTGPGTVERKDKIPYSEFEPITLLSELAVCIGCNEREATSSHMPGTYCSNCWFERCG